MFQTLYDGFLANMLTTVNAITAEMSATLATPFAAAATIYVIAYGIAILRGSVDGSGFDFAIQTLKLGIIFTLVSNAGSYTTWVAQVILVGIPDFVTTLTGGAPGGLPSDGVIARAGVISEEIKEEYSSFNLSGQIYAAVMSGLLYVAASIFGAVAFTITLFAQFGLAIMAAVGPLFVAFALFDFSRGWFFSWLGQIVNFALLQLLVILLAIFATEFIGNVFTQASAVEATQAVVYMLVGLFVVTIFFFLIPSIAAALSGGAQGSTGMLQRTVERSLLRGGGNRGGRGGPRGGRADRSA
ncbi:type IV secretion system protein [Parasulfitobacter algicola]|uniref:Type IV secretion system protein n=1 Tax=Parasulfitobacter algicola TaxID=2614809 RepID=A0ABX2IZS2_9RHOB|nr:type IV secretion system protein [Sulfitobacter algicola]NSX56797.1 type IV secretion system protein [Sulfitobacter algicola]